MAKAIEFDDVADIYDYYVNVDLDIPFFVEELRARKGDVLELMCGTGRVSLPLLKNGVSLTCVDYSSKMLDKLGDKLSANQLQARLVHADVCQMELGRQYETVFIPFNSFMELVGAEKQIAALQSINSHLIDEGLFICTLHNPAVRAGLANGERVFRGQFALPGKQFLRLHSEEHIIPGQSLIKGSQYFTVCNEQGQLLLERRLDICFSLVDKEAFEQMARAAGFSVENLYGNYDRSEFSAEESPFMIFLLKKSLRRQPENP
ncbi:MAG: class I SAM-dependent methyltransferase [Syntrophomonadaceae bacterium]